ncbi:MAG: 7-cyano-7-deazaguanine synthase [Acidobacteria bacterium]|nr:MAG: 7-cyano-7-deazaguanine synthase [Acidobacteriota bacterium]
MADIAVLLSGGLDSAVLAAHAATTGVVQPVYVSSGLAWEVEELALVSRLLQSPPYASRVLPLVRLVVAVSDLYPDTHWARVGAPPAYDTPDQDVYLPGRNVLLLSKAGVLCALRGIPRVAIGPLAGNPFPDATPRFFAAIAEALSLGLDHRLRIETPLASMHKEDVIRLGVRLGVPFELTLSCMRPDAGRHCGLCSKCRERRDGFAAAGVEDPTEYLAEAPR